MSYLTPTRARRPTDNLSFILAVFVLLLLINIFLFSYLNPIFIQVSSFSKKTLDNFSFITYLKSKKSLEQENTELKDKVNSLLAENADKNALQSENIFLNEKLGRVDNKKYIEANVLERPGFSPYDFLVIDEGSLGGVEVDKKVFYNNLVIGVVTEVYKNTSKVELFSSPQKTFDVLVGEKKTPTKAKGQGGGAFEVLLPKGVVVKEGDTIVLPEDPLKVFGFVGSISEDSLDSFQHIFFAIPVNVYEINNVSVSI